MTSARACALSNDAQPEAGSHRRTSGQPIIPVGAMTATGPRACRGIAVASSTSGRIEVAKAGPGHVCSQGMMKSDVLP